MSSSSWLGFFVDDGCDVDVVAVVVRKIALALWDPRVVLMNLANL